MTNAAGKVKGTSKSRFDWQIFDSLPLHCKQLLWVAPVPVHLKRAFPPSDLPYWQQQITTILHKSCLATYGADHPQSGSLCFAQDSDFLDD